MNHLEIIYIYGSQTVYLNHLYVDLRLCVFSHKMGRNRCSNFHLHTAHSKQSTTEIDQHSGFSPHIFPNCVHHDMLLATPSGNVHFTSPLPLLITKYTGGTLCSETNCSPCELLNTVHKPRTPSLCVTRSSSYRAE